MARTAEAEYDPGRQEGNARQEYEIKDSPWWREFITVVQQHDTPTLKAATLEIADRAPQIHFPSFRDCVQFANEIHGNEIRDFTGTSYLNHLYQVFLVGVMITGINNISDAGAKIMVLHDTVENSPTTRDDLRRVTRSDDIPFGVMTLSHRENGVDKYPRDKDKIIYLGHIGQVQFVRPELCVGPAKVSDQLVNANDPVTQQELIRPLDPALINDWNETTGDKIPQMITFHNALNPRRDRGLRQKLSEGVNFTLARMDPHYQGFPNNILRSNR